MHCEELHYRPAVFEKGNIINAFWQTLYPMRFSSTPQNRETFGDV
jgi:hypothetical protein